VRRLYAFLKSPPDDDPDGYIPGLYIKSDYKFPPASADIEAALTNFKTYVLQEQTRYAKHHPPTSNLTPSQFKLINFFHNNDDYIIVEGDKGLGTCGAL